MYPLFFESVFRFNIVLLFFLSAEKRASWRAARLRSLEQGAVEAQDVIRNMRKVTDDLITHEAKASEVSLRPPHNASHKLT